MMKVSIPEWGVARDILLFVSGMLGVAHETLVSTTDRPGLLVLFAAMMGLPAFLRQDERNNGEADSSK